MVIRISQGWTQFRWMRSLIAGLIAIGLFKGATAEDAMSLPSKMPFVYAENVNATVINIQSLWPGLGIGVSGEFAPTVTANPPFQIGASVAVGKKGNGQQIWMSDNYQTEATPPPLQPDELLKIIVQGVNPNPPLAGWAYTYPDEYPNQANKGVILAQDIEFVSFNNDPTKGYVQAALLLWTLRQAHPKGDGNFNTLMPVMSQTMAKSNGFDAGSLRDTFNSSLGADLVNQLGIKFIDSSTNNLYTTYAGFLYGNQLCDVIAIQRYDNSGVAPTDSTDGNVPFPATTVPFILISDGPDDRSVVKTGQSLPSSSQFNLAVPGVTFSATLPQDSDKTTLYMPWNYGVYLGYDQNYVGITNLPGTPPNGGIMTIQPQQIALDGLYQTATHRPKLTSRVTELKATGSGASGAIKALSQGIYCESRCTNRYDSGTLITLTAVPVKGHQFTGWSGACQGKKSTCSLSLTKDLWVTAKFK